ncbi:MAG: hypothetical protein Q4D33_13715, partial [Prevotellaceae bacterium]|nr:hypothetical protein [Prevotellaceae bacterium]
LMDNTAQFQAIHSFHAQISKQDIHVMCPDVIQRILSVLKLSNHFHTHIYPREVSCNPLPGGLFIIY